MKYLLLGGYGFIGRALTKQIPKNCEIIVADSNPNMPKSTDRIKYITLDFTKTTDFSHILSDVDVIFHLVCTVLPNEGTDDLVREIEDNLFSTIHLLDSILSSNSKPRLIFFSSGGTVYGDNCDFPTQESSGTNPICKYGMYKLMTEKLFQLYETYHNLDYCIIRLSNPYGAYVRKDKSQGLIPVLISKLMQNETLEIWGDGENSRDYIYIDDAIDAIIRVANYRGNVRLFNVGSGEPTSIDKIIDIIISELGCTYPTIEYKASRKCDVRKSQLDITLIQQELGWRPSFSIIDGVRLCISKLK